MEIIFGTGCQKVEIISGIQEKRPWEPYISLEFAGYIEPIKKKAAGNYREV